MALQRNLRERNFRVWINCVIRPVVVTMIGLGLAVGPPGVRSGAVFQQAGEILPIWWWGWLSVAVGVAALAAVLVAVDRFTIQAAMLVVTAWFLFWAWMSGASAVNNNGAGFAGVPLWLLAAFGTATVAFGAGYDAGPPA